MRIAKLIPLMLAALMFSNAVHAVATHTKVWVASAFTGSLSENKKIKFYLEPDVRFIDDKYKFEQALLWMALGYQPTPDLIIFIGDAPSTSRNSQGIYTHENILWQQVNWMFYDCAHYRLISRNRFEETKNNHAGPWAVMYRQRLQLKFPLKNWENHAIVISDEIFFDFTNPYWRASSSFLSQNRAYAGLDTQLTKQTLISIGYLNQYQFTHPNQMSHVLLLGMEVNFG